MKCKNIILILSALSFLLSCTTSSPRNRGSLSGAMDKSRDDYEEERRVPDREDDGDRFSRPETPDSESENNNSGSYGMVGESLDPFLLLRSGASFISDPYFDNPLDLEVLIGNSGEGHLGVFFFVGLKTLNVQPDDDISESINAHPFILQCGVELRYYPFEDQSFFSPYLTGRISGFTLFWIYKNSLVAGPDTISLDYLGGVGFDGGLGIDLIKTDNFQAGMLVLPQLFLFGAETSEGFSNDFFLSYGTVRWSFEAGFKL